jgi:hypothetical protein
MDQSTPPPIVSQEPEHWHIDKKVPLALVYLLVGQFLCGVIVAVNMFGQVNNQDKRITSIENQRVSERLVTLESQMSDTKALLQRVDANTLRLLERGSTTTTVYRNGVSSPTQ